MPVMTVKIGHNLADRWAKYRLGAPAWPSLTSLVEALLINHFNEAERMEAMIEKQERKSMDCPRCITGFIHVGLDDVHCLQCNYHPPLKPLVPVYRTTGGICDCGRDLNALGYCKACMYKPGHGQRVRNGLKRVIHECRKLLPNGTECLVRCAPSFRYCEAHKKVKRKIGASLPVVQGMQP